MKRHGGTKRRLRVAACLLAAVLIAFGLSALPACSGGESAGGPTSDRTRQAFDQQASGQSSDTTDSEALDGGSGAGTAGDGNVTDSESGKTRKAGESNAGANTATPQAAGGADTDKNPSAGVQENGTYTGKDEVAAYIHEFHHLPPNYISKTKAKKAGWVSSEGNLDEVCPGMSIGGSVFYNDEGMLPDAPGREWHECDIDYRDGYRNEKRIVYSNDGLVFYTGDHYRSFEQLY